MAERSEEACVSTHCLLLLPVNSRRAHGGMAKARVKGQKCKVLEEGVVFLPSFLWLLHFD